MRSRPAASGAASPWLGRSVSRCCWMVLLLGALGAQAQPVSIPPSLLLPNYDRVYPGLIEALEAGAFVARARNAPAVSYNPAGIALTDRSVLNASAQGYQLTALGGTGFEQASPVSSFEPVPSFVGIVLGRDVIDWESVRLGFAVVTPIHWDQSAIASAMPVEGQRASYDVHSNFSTVVPTVSVGWAVSSSFRLGASIEFPYTTISNEGELSGELTSATASQGSIQNVALGGSTLDVVAALGAQWTALSWLQLGLLFRTPGLKVLSSGAVNFESLTAGDGGSRHVFFDDPDARFEFRTPMEISLGAAVNLGPVELEADLRWHDGTHTYQIFSSDKMGRIVDTTSGAPVISRFAFTGIPYRARPVLNGSFGGHVTVTRAVNLSAGVYLDQSPVDILGQGFRRVDLVGFRTGVGFQVGKVSASLGIGWEHGKGAADLAPASVPSQHEELTLDTFTVLFSVSFAF
jgi:hypothetical protein